jgi:anthranilate synthase component 1
MSFTMNLKTESRTFFIDTLTPVAMYLNLRDQFQNCALFEGADFSALADSHSFICCEPIAEYRIDGSRCSTRILQKETSTDLSGADAFVRSLNSFLEQVKPKPDKDTSEARINGLFGYFGWKAIQYMEDVKFTGSHSEDSEVSAARFYLYRYVIILDALKNTALVMKNFFLEERGSSGFSVDEFAECAFRVKESSTHFLKKGGEQSNLTDSEFITVINQCKGHIQRGDVFQIVPSRQYRQNYRGDDFRVYRALRSINPSPYLFYVDLGEYRIFGSSPEAQIIIRNREASTWPIAGTYRRTGDFALDMENAKKLQEDEKENAEHAMLVDLARNDLSRTCSKVHVPEFRTLRYFSHVIHLVSRVTGQIRSDVSALDAVVKSYPAGTLSGAPKHKALQLLDRYEPQERGIYGGAVGFIDFSGDSVFAIMIRSFLSKRDTLYYQVGMGVVYDSIPEREVSECHAKVDALRAAIEKAEVL